MSKKLDDELANALKETDDADKEPVSVSGVAKPKEQGDRPSPKRNLGLLITLLVMVGAVVSLVMVGFKEAAIYATPVDQLLAQKDKLTGRKVRVEGELSPGSLQKRDQPCEYCFSMVGADKDKSRALPVRYAQCVIPDTFRDVPAGGVQVTVEGTLNSEGSFDATLVMAKCTSKYDPSTHQMQQDSQKPGDLPIN